MDHAKPSEIESKILTIAASILVLAGIFLRLHKYLLDRSFRGDEVALANNVINHSALDLLIKPLDSNQAAPIAFLGLEKLLASVLGSSDYVFRLVPLVAGCASVVLVYILSRKITGMYGAIFVLAGFVLNSSLIIYSSDFKQYSSDVLIAIILYLLLVYHLQIASWHSTYRLGIAGLIAILGSHPSIFIVGSISILLLIHHRRDRQKFIWAIGLSSVWGALFILLYFVSFRSIGHNSYLVQYWKDLNALMPIPPWQDLSWYPVRVGALFTTLLDLPPFAWLEVIIFVFGLISFFLRKRSEWIIAFTAPIFLTVLASGVINYPFKGRLIFFLIPGLLVVLGEGLEKLFQLLSRNRLSAYTAWSLLSLFLHSTPFQSARTILTSARSYPFNEDIRPVVEFIDRNSQAGDAIVLYHNGVAAFRYYSALYGVDPQAFIYSQDYSRQPGKYYDEIESLPRDQRIWFVFSNVARNKLGIDERVYAIDYIEQSGGQLLAQYDADGVSFGYLYILK